MLTNQTRFLSVALALLFASVGIGIAAAQVPEERPDDVVGTITRVSGTDVTVKNDAGGEVRLRLGPRTRVYFRDAGDRREFPNSNIDDLREGMGVRFPPGTASPDHIVVHSVPAGVSRANRPAQPPSRGESRSESRQVKARLQSVGRREIQADVAGRSTTFALDAQASAGRYRSGDLVVLTVEGRGSNEVVTRIESAELSGTVTRVDTRGRSVSIRVEGREENYEVEDRGLIEDVRQGDRVRFDVEERPGGRRIITSLSRER
jgi:Copper binding periplasmic protein CusF